MPVLPLGKIPAFRTHAQRIGAGLGVAYGWVATGKQAGGGRGGEVVELWREVSEAWFVYECLWKGRR